MKKFVFSFVLLVFSTSLFAQYNQEEILKEMQKMQEEMMKSFENLELQFGDSQFLIDTFFVKELQPFGEMNPMQPFSGDMTEMMELLQKELEKMDAEDWQEMQKLLLMLGSHNKGLTAYIMMLLL